MHPLCRSGIPADFKVDPVKHTNLKDINNELKMRFGTSDSDDSLSTLTVCEQLDLFVLDLRNTSRQNVINSFLNVEPWLHSCTENMP